MAGPSEPGLIEPILTGGEDYEILCAISKRVPRRYSN